MTMFKRFAFFAMVNIAMMVMVSTVLSLLGIGNYMTAYGLDYTNLAAFCLVWGMGGSIFSLMISKWMAKRMYGVQIVDENDRQFGWVTRSVHRMARDAGITTMPEVGVYDSPDLNAFATGPSKNSSLVAVSTGLLQNMSQAEAEAVLGHEVSHAANGDMVTMTLIQGVINAFVMFLARVATFAIDQFLRRDDDGEGAGLGFFGHMILVNLFQVVFGILGMVITSWFSRWREYRADAGGAALTSRQAMAGALKRLQMAYENPHLEKYAADTPKEMAAFQISNRSKFLALLSTHPPLEERIKRLTMT